MVLTKWGQDESVDIRKPNEGQMARNLHVRNLDDDLIGRLKRRAARHGRSAEARISLKKVQRDRRYGGRAITLAQMAGELKEPSR